MDYAEENFLGNFSVAEAVLLVVGGISLISIRYRDFSECTPGTMTMYLRSELRALQASFSRAPLQIR